MNVPFSRQLPFFAILTAAACTSSPAISSNDRTALVISGITIVDPVANGASRTNQTIVVREGRIVEVGESQSVTIPAGAQTIDGRSKFAIPGLWDMHVHFMNTGRSALPVYVATGVTSVREMGGYLDSTRLWQAGMKDGSLVGPRIMTPGPILESPTYLARVRQRDAGLGGRLAPRILPYRIGVADSAQAARAMDSLKNLGVDFVKIRTVASKEAFLAILSEAARVGLTVSGHYPGVVSITEAAEAGMKSIEHGFIPATASMSDSARTSLYTTFARNRTWYTPSLAVSRALQVGPDSANALIWGPNADALDPGRPYASQWLLGWWRMQVDERDQQSDSVRDINRRLYESSVADVKNLANAGVRILAGSDAGSVLVYPGFGLHEELRLLVEDAGLSPRQALWAATLGPALLFGMEKELGTIERGRIADIVILDADPLANIRNTRTASFVIQRGRVFDRPALNKLLDDVRLQVSVPATR